MGRMMAAGLLVALLALPAAAAEPEYRAEVIRTAYGVKPTPRVAPEAEDTPAPLGQKLPLTRTCPFPSSMLRS